MQQAKRPRLDLSESENEQPDCGLVESSSSTESLAESEESQLDPELEADMEQYRKPDASYIELIAKAILDSPEQKLRLHDLYDALEKKHPYFQVADAGWKNSVRHNLSLHECFCKSERCGNGKGHYWSIHPIHLQDFQAGDFRRRTVQSRARQLHQQQQQIQVQHHKEAGVRGGVLPSSPIPLTSPPSTILSPLGGQTSHFHFPTPSAQFGSPPVMPSPIPISPMLPTSPSALMYNPAIGGFYYTAFPFPFMCGPAPASNQSQGYTPPAFGSSGSSLLAGSVPPPPPPPSLPSNNSCISSTTMPQPFPTNLDVPPMTGSSLPGAALAPQSTAITSGTTGPPVLPPVCCINAGPPPSPLGGAAASSHGGNFSTTSTLTAGIRSHILQENLKQSPFSIDSILASRRN